MVSPGIVERGCTNDSGDLPKIYRRFPADWWHSSSSKKPLPQRVFRPRPWRSVENPGDSDGISVSDSRLTTAVQASICPRTNRSRSVVSVSIEEVVRLNLTLKLSPEDHDPGHSLIPELNSLDARDNRRAEVWIEETALALSKLAKCEIEESREPTS